MEKAARRGASTESMLFTLICCDAREDSAAGGLGDAEFEEARDGGEEGEGEDGPIAPDIAESRAVTEVDRSALLEGGDMGRRWRRDAARSRDEKGQG